ncbi:flagellar assembly protein FliH [Bacillus sp. 31A1R]|uniref:Flagellar assembly protein FliH n=1 Tax=Robertmurraya mangrovi TaxID=3098077 RepID=A0ABU5J250_9BACI|nr:flagellar assembly protein FliH [Bacillus sp. 31A1R]MDZ5473483.1 flagellar assembly protein FliH [Bacillus sp. 31A1R]
MISLSRLIKSQWAPPSGQQKNKVISIKVLKQNEELPEPQPILSLGMEEREQIIEEAKSEAQLIINEAKHHSDMLYQQLAEEKMAWDEEKVILTNQAKEMGFEEGFAQGQQVGYEEFKEQIEQAKQVVEASKQDYIDKIESSESEILRLGLKVAERILGDKISGKPEQFLSIVKRALKEAREYREVQLHVNPIHFGFLLSQKEDLVKIFPKETELYIYPDDELLESSCIIESANGRIDASVDQQLEEIRRKLFELLESE